MATWTHVYPAAVPIPVDLFVSKKHPGLNGDLGFADSQGNIVFKVNFDKLSKSSSKRVLLDASGNPLITVFRDGKGSWQGFKGVNRTVKKLTRTELEVFLVGEISRESTPDFKMKGFAFQRSCTIYRSDSIVAQTSLMYKLHQIYAGRSKFRLTIFPGSVDHSLIASLIISYMEYAISQLNILEFR
uniref:Protein LURP-one-related 7 n=1 Tax=Salix viminalis TaxID=40686 RepID=A0A6N2L062_SALVM